MEKGKSQVQCADCQQWIDRDVNHTCKQQIKANRRAASKEQPK